MNRNLLKQYSSGFTLAEMMVAIAIIGVLAAFAIPSYQSYVEKTNLSEAKTSITNIYQRIENEKLVNPRNLLTEDNVTDFVNERIAAIPAQQRAKYTFTPLVNAEGKMFSVNIQATPARDGNKFYLWSNSSGSIFKCKYSGSASLSSTKPSDCESF